MKNLKIEVNRENEVIKTFGLTKDGACHFGECGLSNEMSDDEITEFLEERESDYNVTVIFV